MIEFSCFFLVGSFRLSDTFSLLLLPIDVSNNEDLMFRHVKYINRSCVLNVVVDNDDVGGYMCVHMFACVFGCYHHLLGVSGSTKFNVFKFSYDSFYLFTLLVCFLRIFYVDYLQKMQN